MHQAEEEAGDLDLDALLAYMLADMGKEESRGGVFEEPDDDQRAFLAMDPDLVLHVGSLFLILSLILGQ